MKPKAARTTSWSNGLGTFSMQLRCVTIATVIVLTCLVLCYPFRDALAVPTANEVMKDLPFSDGQQQQILNGEIVQWTTSESSDRELAVGMALLLREKPEGVAELFREAVGFKIIGAVTANGEITGKGTLADFARLALEPNGEEEAKRYLDAEPGDSLNLDAKEIAAFQKLKTTLDRTVEPIKAVEVLVRQNLLARYRTYKATGLSGIPAFARGGREQLDLGQELLLATKASQVLAKHIPSFHKILLNYPAVDSKELEEWFYWVNIDVFGRPTFVLSHRMLLQDGEVYVAADRHFYASHDYNGLQAVAGLLPIKDGSMLIYLYRVSTEQVAGFGSSLKHPIARGLMGPYVEELFEEIRARANTR